MGYSVGQRMIELVGLREKITKRETKIVNMLQVIYYYYIYVYILHGVVLMCICK